MTSGWPVLRRAWEFFPFALLAILTIYTANTVPGLDAYQYWSFDTAAPYEVSDVAEYGVLYSPAFLQLIYPLHELSWEATKLVWTGIEMAALVFLVGPWLALALAGGGMTLVGAELINLNTSLLLGAAIWAGFRYPALWAFPLLTKVTPGVGLLWFAIRREWRALGLALGVTGAIVGVSVITVPDWWADWIGVLAGNIEAARGTDFAPLWARALASIAIVTYGAWRGMYWCVPLGAALAHPDAPMIIWVVMLGAVRFYVLSPGVWASRPLVPRLQEDLAIVESACPRHAIE